MSCRIVSNLLCGSSFGENGFTLALNSNGEIHYTGSNEELFGKSEERVLMPTIIRSLKNIINISCGYKHMMCLDGNGKVFSIGSNLYGQLGCGRNSLQGTKEPQMVELPPCTQVSCGYNFTICLDENGNLYSFGDNNYGQLGLGHNENSDFPQKIECLKDIEFVECGYEYAICKSKDKYIYGFGINRFGTLGIGTSLFSTNSPVKCENWPNDVVDIKCGASHTLILTSTMDVYSCGNNDCGQLGRDTADNTNLIPHKIDYGAEIVRIECGYHHSMCIDVCGDLILCGLNQFGQLGLGNTENQRKPIKHPSLKDIVDISRSSWSTFVKTSNNEIYAFGYNYYSQLGIKTEHENQITPIRVFEDNEDIWFSNINKSKQKSARF